MSPLKLHVERWFGTSLLIRSFSLALPLELRFLLHPQCCRCLCFQLA
jgi:hypothetical protein